MEPRAATPKTKPPLTTDHQHRIGKQEGPPHQPEGRFSPRRKPRHTEQAIANYLRTLKT